MAEVISYRFLVRGGAEAAVAALNEVPLRRELVIETDTLKMKLGDGVTRYNDLPYFSGGSTIITVSAAPTAGEGQDGDYAIWPSSTAPMLYGPKAAGAWPAGVPLKGANGASGSAWLRGTAAPVNSLGANGDYYLRTTTNDVYAKAAGAWSVVGNLQGSPGAPGEKGDAGVPGPSSHCFPTASFSGGAGVIEVGASQSLYVPFGFTITGAALIADRVGTVQVDIRKTSFATYPPSSLNSICGGAPPTLSNVDKAIVSDLSLWDVAVVAGDTLQFICTACVGIKAATLTLTGFRS